MGDICDVTGRICGAAAQLHRRGMFWVQPSAQAGLCARSQPDRGILNLLFLLSIILLPVTTGLYAATCLKHVTALYGFNLTLISALQYHFVVIACRAPARLGGDRFAPAFATVVFSSLPSSACLPLT